MDTGTADHYFVGSSVGQRPDAVAEADRLKQTLRHQETSLAFHRRRAHPETVRLTDDVSSARWQLNWYLRRHFYTTAEVARLLGVSERLVQAMASQGPTAIRCDSGEVLVVGLPSIRYGKLWFPKTDIESLLAGQRVASRD